MLVSRLLLLSCIVAISGSAARGQNAAPAGTTDRNKPVPPPEPSVTFSSVHVDEPYIALTFDDGPNATLTPKLLDLLATHHIKATFFVLGECVAQNPEVLQRAAREGHEIGNHSWSHPNFGKMSDEAVRSQLRRTDDLLKNLIGRSPTVFRPPYGSITARQKRWIHEEFGYETILWDVDPLDWKRPGPMTVCNRIVKETRPGSIVLSHDIHPGTIEAMPATLAQLEAKHFKFVTVSELIGLATPEPPKPTPAPRPHASTTSASSGPAKRGNSSADSQSPLPPDNKGRLQPAAPPPAAAASPGG